MELFVWTVLILNGVGLAINVVLIAIHEREKGPRLANVVLTAAIIVWGLVVLGVLS